MSSSSSPTPIIDCGFPVIRYKGDDPFEWGRSHGAAFAPAIKQLAHIRRGLMLDKNPALATKLEELALEQWQSTERQSPLIARELAGIQQGAGLTLTELVILNNYTDFRDITLPDEGCSTVATSMAKSSLAGQTWDMHGSAKNFLCLIHVPQTREHPECLILSLVGCVGLMGISNNQLFVGVNNINTSGARPGLIWPVLVRHLLLQKNFKAMTDSLKKLKVTSGHNYLLSSPQESEHWEVTPDVIDQMGHVEAAREGFSFHTNHCLGPNVKKLEMSDSLSSTTFARFKLLERKLPQVADMNSFYQLLTDHEEYPKSICSHFQVSSTDPSQTCGGGIVDWKSGALTFWRGCPVHDSNFIKRDVTLAGGKFSFQQSLPYLVTWTAQKNATVMPMAQTFTHSFQLMNGQRVQDLSSLSLQASFGLRPQFITVAIVEQLHDMPIAPIRADYELKTRATNKLLQLIEGPTALGKIFYTVSGAESIENALKLARHMTSRPLILARRRSYHGASMGALAVTGDWRREGHLLPSEWTVRLPEPTEDPSGEKTLALIAATGPERIAAVCIETVSGANGAESFADGWWATVPAALKKFGIKLILDEVVCGFGRTGKDFGFHHRAVTPDFITMAKAISGGVIPFGALWVNASVADHYREHVLSAGLTQYANPAGLAAMEAVIDYLKLPFVQARMKELEAMHQRFLKTVSDLNAIKATRRHGHLMAIEVDRDINWSAFQQGGLYFISKDRQCVLAPAMNYDPTELERGYELFLSLLKKELKL